MGLDVDDAACGYELLPPLRPAEAFCDLEPPPPPPPPPELPPPPLFLPPFFEAWLPEPAFAFEIFAARSLLMPFLRRPSYCLSFLTLDPWSFAMGTTSFGVVPQPASPSRPPANASRTGP